MNFGLALLLSIQASAPGPENWTYLTCITNSARVYLSTRPSRAKYERHLTSACGEERVRLRRQVIKRQMTQGQSRAEAERGADEFFATIRIQMLDLQPRQGDKN